jgi:hypothetical protein
MSKRPSHHVIYERHPEHGKIYFAGADREWSPNLKDAWAFRSRTRAEQVAIYDLNIDVIKIHAIAMDGTIIEEE